MEVSELIGKTIEFKDVDGIYMESRIIEKVDHDFAGIDLIYRDENDENASVFVPQNKVDSFINGSEIKSGEITFSLEQDEIEEEPEPVVEETVVEETIIEQESTPEELEAIETARIQAEELAASELLAAENLAAELAAKIEAERLNKPEYKYYVVDNNRIISGFEYQEDAKKELKKHLTKGDGYEIKTMRDLIAEGVDVNDNANWKQDYIDSDLIFSALSDSHSSINEYNRDFWSKLKIEDAIDKKRFGSLEKLVEELSKEYLKLFSLYSNDKTNKHYLNSKKYLQPLIKQMDIIGDSY